MILSWSLTLFVHEWQTLLCSHGLSLLFIYTIFRIVGAKNGVILVPRIYQWTIYCFFCVKKRLNRSGLFSCINWFLMKWEHDCLHSFAKVTAFFWWKLSVYQTLPPSLLKPLDCSGPPNEQCLKYIKMRHWTYITFTFYHWVMYNYSSKPKQNDHKSNTHHQLYVKE